MIITKEEIENSRIDDIMFTRSDYGIDFPIVIWGEINSIPGFECLSFHYKDHDYYYSLSENFTIENEWYDDAEERINEVVNKISKETIMKVINEKYKQCIEDDVRLTGSSVLLEIGKVPNY